jgi:hypothetical protein
MNIKMLIEDYDDELVKVNKKYNFEYDNKDSYFYESRGYGRRNPSADKSKKRCNRFS